MGRAIPEVNVKTEILDNSRSESRNDADVLTQMTESEEAPHDDVIETANLDGETSLKTRHSASLTKQARDGKQLTNMFGCIECENPNPKLDSFLGRLTMWSCKEGDEPEV